ncbi:hypothetical protein PAMP_000053 [Pampus punctatissimus]
MKVEAYSDAITEEKICIKEQSCSFRDNLEEERGGEKSDKDQNQDVQLVKTSRRRFGLFTPDLRLQKLLQIELDS